jgi:hypothetical protein
VKPLMTLPLAVLSLGLLHEGDVLANEPVQERVAEGAVPLTASAHQSVNGLWNNALWNNGMWGNGIWANGMWTNGFWQNGLSQNGMWSNGLWANGFWNNGLWGNGFWNNGLWSNGLWGNGFWVNGLWANGFWVNGFWVNGIWNNGFWQNGLWSNGLIAADDAAGVAPQGRWLSTALRPEYGLSVRAGLSTDAGLAHAIGLMASENGRRVASYAVKCALPAGRTIEKFDARGNVHTFEGAVGIAPEWENGRCGEDCQEWMTACLLAHVNLTGKHVAIWVTGDHPAVRLDTNRGFSLEEAAFFGNVFTGPPAAYACAGRQAKEHPIAGRACMGNASCPYADPYQGVSCEASGCSSGRAPSGERSGYVACEVGTRRWDRVVTTYKP